MPKTKWSTLQRMYQILTLEFALIGRPHSLIKKEVEFVGYKQDRGVWIRIVEANKDTGDIVQRYRRIESLFRQLQVSAQLLTSCAAV